MKRVPHLDEFPEDVQKVVYEILATALLRMEKEQQEEQKGMEEALA